MYVCMNRMIRMIACTYVCTWVTATIIMYVILFISNEMLQERTLCVKLKCYFCANAHIIKTIYHKYLSGANIRETSIKYV